MQKIARDVERDASNLAALKREGWSGAVVWKCELAQTPRVQKRLGRFLSSSALNEL